MTFATLIPAQYKFSVGGGIQKLRHALREFPAKSRPNRACGLAHFLRGVVTLCVSVLAARPFLFATRKEKMADFVKCKCQHCNGLVEFDPSRIEPSSSYDRYMSGNTAQCPHCGLDTVLVVPPEPLSAPVRSAPTKRSRGFKDAAKLVLCAVSVVLIGLIAFAIFSTGNRNPPGLSGVYRLDHYSAIDLRINGRASYCGKASDWYVEGGKIKIEPDNGRNAEFKQEGEDLVDSEGNRWMRAH